MAVLVPTSTEFISLGNKRGVIGMFSAASDTDTWNTGLSKVDMALLTNGANDVDIGATYATNVVTVQTAGALANLKILAIGV